MSIITIVSDWHKNDYYLAALKGKILSNVPSVQIIDISHNIKPFNIFETAFILKNSFYNFPENTIHLICVNLDYSEENPLIVAKANNHFFVGVDNGIFSLMFDENIEEAVKIKLPIINKSFVELDIYPEVVKKIIQEKKINNLGEKYEKVKKQTQILPVFNEDSIDGIIIYIDSYYNAITNISKDLFYKLCDNRKFHILVQSNYYKISKISQSYNETPPGELVALFNSIGLLEIAINQGKITELLNLNIGSTIRIKFY